MPGSNGRPPACKARAAAAVYCCLSLRRLGKRSTADICCALLRFAASRVLPQNLLLSHGSDSGQLRRPLYACRPKRACVGRPQTF